MSIAADVTRGPGAVKLAPPPALSYVGAEGPMTSLSPVLALLHLVWSQHPDSLTTLRAARRAQATFESIRREHLPYGSGHSSGSCDLRIGRFCYWYDDDRREDLAPEPQPIRDARATLLAALDDAGARRECRADGWWCAALLGLALHAAGDFARADSAFDLALGDMPEPERCRWYDLGPLLPAELRRRYERLSCDDRGAFESRWWWLA